MDDVRVEVRDQLETALDAEATEQKNFHIRQAMQLLELDQSP